MEYKALSDINPVFIISLPRSGSTLLQRIIATNPRVSTVSESWLLLPLLSMHTSRELYSEYGQRLAKIAINEFTETLPDGINDFRDSLSSFVLELYRKSADSSSVYFIEKTPRNVLVIEELFSTFPDAKYIYLWRNPVSILSSMLESFSEGKWRLYSNYVDLYKGYELMFESFNKNKDKVLSINYEELVNDQEKIVSQLEKYLSIEISPYLDDLSNIPLYGSMGDKVNPGEDSVISKNSINKWRYSICNQYRKEWAKKYIKWVGEDRLSRTGYDYKIILEELISIRPGVENLLSDLLRAGFGYFRRILIFDIIKRQLNKRQGMSRRYILY